jgi:hypothetical protein
MEIKNDRTFILNTYSEVLKSILHLQENSERLTLCGSSL